MRGMPIGTNGCKRCAQAFGAAQTFGHHSFAEATFLMSGMCTNRLEDRGARHIVKPDGAKRGEFAVRRDGNDIEIAIIEWDALNVFVPLPALIFAVRFIGVKDFPR